MIALYVVKDGKEERLMEVGFYPMEESVPAQVYMVTPQGQFNMLPASARWLSDALWLFAAQADGQNDRRSKRLLDEAAFG